MSTTLTPSTRRMRLMRVPSWKMFFADGVPEGVLLVILVGALINLAIRLFW